MPSPRGRATAAFAAVAVLSLVVLFSPSSPAPSWSFPHLDKVVHVSLFALLAGAARWRFGAGTAVLLAVCAYAPVSEVLQGWVLPERSADWHDVVADLSGTALGWLLATRLLRPAPAATRA